MGSDRNLGWHQQSVPPMIQSMGFSGATSSRTKGPEQVAQQPKKKEEANKTARKIDRRKGAENEMQLTADHNSASRNRFTASANSVGAQFNEQPCPMP